MIRRTTLCAGIAAALVVCTPAWADMLSLKDGRFVQGRPMEHARDGYRIEYENGTIVVPEELVLDFFEEDDTGEWVPTTEKEKKQFEKGLVPWRRGWISKSRRDRLRQKEREAERLRVKQREERRLWRNHATVETKRFVFHHTLSDEAFQNYQDLFETYYEVFTKEWKIKATKKFGKPEINIYHDEEYFHQVSGAQQGVAGWYMPRTRELHFYYDRNRETFTVDVMFHEGNHMLTHMINERVWYPAWINEGLGEYYGASEWDPEQKTMKTGLLQSARLAVLWDEIEADKWQDLEVLIKTPRINATQYAWAWTLCHFMMSTPKYAEKFKKYFVTLGRGKGVKRRDRGGGEFLVIPTDEQMRLLKKHIGYKTLADLQQEWYAYIEEKLDIEKNELDWAGAAWIMDLKGERSKARKFFKKAIEGGSKSGFVHYGYADLQFKRGKLKTALKYAQLAAGLDPLHGRSHFLMGKCKYISGEEDEGERLMKLGIELDPDDNLMQFEYEQEKLKAEERKKAKQDAGG